MPATSQYVVKPRDTLWGIAARLLGDGERYREIAALNYGRPQPDGRTLTRDHWIQPGWRLVLPADTRTGDTSRKTPRHRWYVVQPHDTLTSIAARELGDPDRYAELVRLNRNRRQPDGQRLINPDLIRPGWRLLLPRQNHTGSNDHDGKRPPHRDDRSHHSPSTAPTPPKTTTPSARSTPSSTPSNASAHHHGARTVLDFPSGAVVGASLATAVGAAIATARLHRRRRYRPGDHSTPDTEPPPSSSLRRLRRHTISDHGGHASPTVPSRGSPHEFAIASRDGHEIMVDLVGTNGLGLHGPGADDAARAVLVTLLAATDPVEVVTTEPTLQLLCGVEHVGDIPTPATLTVTPTLTAALEHLEAELIHRTRLLDSYDTDDVTTLQRDHPDEPLPTIALIATDASDAERRLDAVLTLGRSRAVTAVLLGHWHSGTTCHVDDDGTVTHATGPGSTRLQNSRLFHLPHTDTTDLVAVLTAARGGRDRTSEHGAADPDEPAASVAKTYTPARSDAPVHLSVFGPVRVHVGDTEIATGLRSRAREVLAYLATRPDGATLDQTLAAVWPDTDPERAAAQFRAAVGNIRKALRDTTGAREARFVLYSDQRYRLDPQLVDVDLWRFHAHLRQSQDDKDPQAAFERAVHAYSGDLADGHMYEWAEPLRESLRRRALDAYTRLAETQEHHGELDEAVTTLDRALDHDPYNEQLYQRSFRLLHQLGRADAVRRLYRQLQNRLADLDADPEPATEQLVAEFLNIRRTSR